MTLLGTAFAPIGVADHESHAFLVIAQASAPALPSTLPTWAAILLALAPYGVQFAAQRVRAQVAESRQKTEASRVVAKANADARVAEAEEVTGRFEIEAPALERFATQDRAERVATQAKYEQSLFTIADLDRALAAANERVRVLTTEVERVNANMETLLDWIEENLPNAGAPPIKRRARERSHVVAIEENNTSSKDDRREP